MIRGGNMHDTTTTVHNNANEGNEGAINVLPIADEQREVKEGNEDLISNALKHFPKRVQTRAKLISGYFDSPIEENRIHCNNKGELMIGNNTFRGSSISDLLYDTSCRKRGYTPLFAQKFYNALANNNTPPGLIMNIDRRGWVKADEQNMHNAESSKPHSTRWETY